MKKIVLGVLGIIIIVILIAGGWLYIGKFTESKAKAFKKLSLPMASVGSQTISGHDFFSRFELAEELYKNEADYNKTQTESDILNQLIDDAKLRAIARTHGITVSQNDIDTQYQAVVDQFGSGDAGKFTETLRDTYHLTPEEFKAKVLTSDILQTNLNVWFNGQKDLNKAAYDQLQQLQSKLDQGQPFEEVVKAYTQDEATKDFGGDTGFVKLSELAPEFRAPLEKAKAGESVVIVSRYGLHIVKVVEIDTSGTEASYHLQQIFVKVDGFDDWYAKQADTIKARKLVKF